MRASLLSALRRVVALLFGLLLLCAAAWAAAAAAGRLPPLGVALPGLGLQVDPAAAALWPDLALLVLLGLIGGIGVTTLGLAPATAREDQWLELRSNAGPHDAVVSIAMSRRSIHALVAFQARQLPGVRAVVPQVTLTRKGWSVRVLLELWVDASVSDVTDALRLRLFEALPHHTGLPIADLQLDLVFAGDDAQRRVA